MTTKQKIIRGCAIALAILLVISIFYGMLQILMPLLGRIVGDDDAVGDAVTPMDVGGESFIGLEIEINAAALNVTVGDAWAVETNLNRLRVKVLAGVLVLEETTRGNHGDYDGAVLNVTVPRDVTLRSVEIHTGAGEVRIEALVTERLEMELGAGRVEIASLQVNTAAEIETGAGEFVLHNGSIRDLSLQAGIGKVTGRVALTGSCEMELGIGKTDLTLLGDVSTYCISAERGIGSCTVDGRSLSRNERYGTGDCRVHIEGGIGEVSVQLSPAAE